MFSSNKFMTWVCSPDKNNYFELTGYEQRLAQGILSFSATDKTRDLLIYPFNSPNPDPDDDRFIRKKYDITIFFCAGNIPKIKPPEDIVKKIIASDKSLSTKNWKTELHIFKNGTCCLCVEAELMYKLKMRIITEDTFIEQMVIPFFYRFGCVECRMIPPSWGERSHDFRGLLESYRESGEKWDCKIFSRFTERLKDLLITDDKNHNGRLWKFIYKSTENKKLLRSFYDAYSNPKKKRRLCVCHKSVLIEIRKRHQSLQQKSYPAKYK